MVGKAQESHGTISELNSVSGLEKVDRWNPISTSAIHFKTVSLHKIYKTKNGFKCSLSAPG
jgi:hypothetical protein